MLNLRSNFHIVVFSCLTIAILKLQISHSGFGWPFPIGLQFAWINLIAVLPILSLAMLPFGYDDERRMPLSSLFLLTFCGASSASIIPRSYFEEFVFVDRLSILFLTTLMLFGLLFKTANLLFGYGKLPPNTLEDTG